MKIKKEKLFSGMTLIEMLMAIGIFVIGIAGFTLLFSKTWKVNSYTLEMGQASMSVSQGLNKIGDYLRRARQGDDGSYPIRLATENEIVFFCDYNKDGITERLHIYKSGQNILMGIRNPTATLPKTYPSGDSVVVNIVSNIINNTSTPIFYYYNSNYPADEINNPLSLPISVSDVRLMKIYLEMNIDINRSPDNIKMQTFVEMRNLNDYNLIQ